MKIVADENILLVKELFTAFGDVVTLPGKEISSAIVKDADILLVRSVTKVNAALLAESSIRFVGTATIGTDHLDLSYLEQKSIAYASAPGCNAEAVVEYVLSAVFSLAQQNDFLPLEKSWAIVGCGNVGGLLYKKLQSLGIRVCTYDPFLAASNDIKTVDYDAVFQCDIISFHTPLTYSGPYPTYHMLTSEQLNKIKPGTVLLNSGRGEVFDHHALLNFLQRRNDIYVVLDVWENEPNIDKFLVPFVDIATAHIAGYSAQGKRKASMMICHALQSFLGKSKSTLDIVDSLIEKEIVVHADSFQQAILRAVTGSYDIFLDDQCLRTLVDASSMNEIGDNFESIRKSYHFRPEYSSIRITLEYAASENNLQQEKALLTIRAALSTLGFRMAAN